MANVTHHGYHLSDPQPHASHAPGAPTAHPTNATTPAPPAEHATPGTTPAPPTTQKTTSLPLAFHPRDTSSPHRSRIHRLLLLAFREHRALGEAHPPSRPPPSPRMEPVFALVLRVPQEAVLRHRARSDTIRCPGNHL